MTLRAPPNMKCRFAVMPAWIAGIQVREDAFGNIHVSLDSSTPCWNDTIKEALLKVTEVFSNERLPGTIL